LGFGDTINTAVLMTKKRRKKEKRLSHKSQVLPKDKALLGCSSLIPIPQNREINYSTITPKVEHKQHIRTYTNLYVSLIQH